MQTPKILTTVVGSYPLPSWLASQPSSPNLTDALHAVVKTQELAGLDVLSDGELTRFDVNHPETNGMIDYFVRPLGGVHADVSRAEIGHWNQQENMAFRRKPAAVVRGAVDEGTLNLPDDWRKVKSLSQRPIKFTLTSPYMLAKTLLDEHYRDIRRLTGAIAEVLAAQVAEIDAPVVQVDEAHLTGHPEDREWAVEPINRVLGAARNEKGLHLCFGNYGGQSIQKGFWKDLIPFFNELNVDHLVLEFARRGYDELEAFKDMKETVALGIGVIDIKDNIVESPETVARRIERAVEILGESRIRWAHPDCGFWMLPRSVADRKMAALVAGRDLVLGCG